MADEGELPSAAKRIADHYPDVWEAYVALGKASSASGSLDAKTLRLVKIALAVGAGLEGAVHSHVRRALHEGIAVDDIRHVAIATIPTLGFSSGLRALSWIDDLTEPGS